MRLRRRCSVWMWRLAAASAPLHAAGVAPPPCRPASYSLPHPGLSPPPPRSSAVSCESPSSALGSTPLRCLRRGPAWGVKRQSCTAAGAHTHTCNWIAAESAPEGPRSLSSLFVRVGHDSRLQGLASRCRRECQTFLRSAVSTVSDPHETLGVVYELGAIATHAF